MHGINIHMCKLRHWNTNAMEVSLSLQVQIIEQETTPCLPHIPGLFAKELVDKKSTHLVLTHVCTA